MANSTYSKIPRLSKPIPGVGVDWSNPLTNGLVFLYAFNESSGLMTDLVTRTPATSSNATWSSSPSGSCQTFNGTSQYVNCGSSPSWAFSGPMSMLSLCNPTSTVSQGVIEFRSSNNSGGFSMSPNFTTNGMLEYVTGNGTSHNVRSNASMIDGLWHLYGIAHDASAAVRFYRDGVPWGVSSVALPSAYGSGLLGTNPLHSTHWLNGSMSLAAIWSRALSQQEFSLLTANPWQLFRPTHIIGTATVSGFSGGGTVTATHAVVSSAGSATVPTYSGTTTLSRHPTASSTGSYGASVFAGTATLSRHPTISSTASRTVPTYSGTTTLSRHPTIVSSSSPTYAGTATLTTKHPTIPLSATPTNYWKMDTLASSTAVDSIGGNNATSSGSVSLVTTPLPSLAFSDAGCYKFAGLGGELTLHSTISLAGTWSLSVWINPTSSPTFGASSIIAGDGSGLGIYFAYPGVLTYGTSSSTTSASTSWSLNTWQHVCVTFSSGTVTLYQGGVNVGSATGKSGSVLATIANDLNGNSYLGYIDDYRVYGVALTSSQVSTLAAGNELDSSMKGVFVPGYAGTTTLSRHPNISATGTHVPHYSGTTTLSRHPTVSSTGSVGAYAGSTTVSRHPTVSSSGTRAVPVYGGSSTLSRHPTVAATATRVVPTYSGSASLSRHPTIASVAVFTPPSSFAVMNMFLGAGAVPVFAGELTLLVVGSSIDTLGGASSAKPLYASGWDNPPQAQMNLWMDGYQPLAGMSAVLNLWTQGGYASIDASAPLYIENLQGEASSFANLYIRGLGTTPGAIPLSASLDMTVQRGPYGGITLFIQNNGVNNSIPLFMMGSPVESNQIPMFIIGYGGTSSGDITLVVPLATSPVTASNQVTLAMPDVVGAGSATRTLYINGWRPI